MGLLREIVRGVRKGVKDSVLRGEMKRDGPARELWAEVYPKLTARRSGIVGQVLGRAEAHVLRLSMLFALLDSDDAIRVPHLRAALALWSYSEKSVRGIFGNVVLDPIERKILDYLAIGPATMTELVRASGGHRSAEWMQARLGAMVADGRLVETRKDGERKEKLRAWALPPE